MNDAGVPVDLCIEGEPRPLATLTDWSAYRVVQEALTNVLKHAGRRQRSGHDLLRARHLRSRSSTTASAPPPAPTARATASSGMRERVTSARWDPALRRASAAAATGRRNLPDRTGIVNPTGGTRCVSSIVDDDVPTRIGLQTIFETEPDIEVVGEAADGHEACLLADTLSPDVVLMDVRLPRLDGISATRRIVDADSPPGPRRVRVVVLTTFDDEPSSARHSKRARAQSFSNACRRRSSSAPSVPSPRCPDDEEPARIGMGRRAQPHDRSPSAPRRSHSLTEREREVLVLMAQGGPTRRSPRCSRSVARR